MTDQIHPVPPPTLIQQNAFKGLPEIMIECAARSDIYVNFDMRFPWREGDYAYAANGSIMARVPLATLSILTRERLRVAHDIPANLPDHFRTSAPWQARPIRHFAVTETLTCKCCKGTGHHFREGQPFPCHHCQADGWIWNHVPLDVGPGVQLSSCFVATLQRYGAKIYLPDRADPSEVACLFRLGAVTGLLMPMGDGPQPQPARKTQSPADVEIEMHAGPEIPPEVVRAIRHLAEQVFNARPSDDDDDDDEGEDVQFLKN